LGLHVQTQRALVPVEPLEPRVERFAVFFAAVGPVNLTAGPFDLDHVCPEVGEVHRTQWSGDGLPAVDYADI
jgi:hypothetical protein